MGRVYALEKYREALNQLTQTAESQGLKNIVQMELEDVIDEIENSGFCFESEFFKGFVHDESHNIG